MGVLKKPKSTFTVEDRIHAYELPRVPEVREYAAAVRSLIRRSVPMRFASLMVGGYIGWLIIKIVGVGDVGPTVRHSEQMVALQVSIGWIGVMAFFVIPVVAMVYRGRWFRVSKKGINPNRTAQQPQFYDQDAL